MFTFEYNLKQINMGKTIEQIKNLRKEVGIKQYVLAEMLCIEQSNYANMENGKLITGKLNEIIEKAETILIPMLDVKISNTQSRLDLLLSIRDQFNHY